MNIVEMLAHELSQDIKQMYALIFSNQNISVNITHTALKYVFFRSIQMEGSLSKTFDIIPSFSSMKYKH